MIQFYNSLSQKKEPFVPVEAGKATIYYCGMTVYDHCHIGHARSWVVFEALKRFLQNQQIVVTMVRNITDIDDKIIARANEHGVTANVWANKFITSMHQDESDLGLLPLDHEPRATAYLDQMIALIEKLIAKNMAYVTEKGDVCFSVRAYPDYGDLSKRDIDALRKGVRKEVNTDKRDPLDFIMWKLAKPGEPSWPSPWGAGRPGWHIECSAMAGELLDGRPIDIHGGGLDLKFPHHENEIAQSQAAHDCTFANTWMHIGLVQVGTEKMSKSLGNFITIRDLLNQYDPEILRYFLMSAHYRSPITFTPEHIAQAQIALNRLYAAIIDVDNMEVEKDAAMESFHARYIEALSDDFNTPEAFAVLFELARTINRLNESGEIIKAKAYAHHLKYLGSIIGLLQQDPEHFIQGDESDLDIAAIEKLVAARQQARADKDWGLADQLRDQLLTLGVVCEDASANKRGWRRKTD